MSSPALDEEAIGGLAPSGLFSLEGSVAIVTGAAGGIGRWLAAGLGAAGASVLVTDIEGSGVDELEASLRAAGVDASALPADLADEEALDRIVYTAAQRFGAVHVLVNNAAVNKRMPILEMDGDTWDRIVRINLRAPFFLAKRAAQEMIAQGAGGSIISISSLNVAYALEHVAVYGATKAGISQMTRHMALEWAEYGIRVNAIAPGWFSSEMTTEMNSESGMAFITSNGPMPRMGDPSELDGPLLLLASDAGSFMTGTTIVVDGGWTAR